MLQYNDFFLYWLTVHKYIAGRGRKPQNSAMLGGLQDLKGVTVKLLHSW